MASSDTEIKLYLGLVDQLHRYNSITWQVPTALFGVNVLTIAQWKSALGLFLLFLLNTALIYAFAKMVWRHTQIIEAKKKAETKLQKDYADFIPVFKDFGPSARKVIVVVLAGLNAVLLVYAICVARAS